MIEGLETGPSFAGGRHINQRQHYARNDLEDEHDERGTAKNVKPARCFARNAMFRSLAYE